MRERPPAPGYQWRWLWLALGVSFGLGGLFVLGVVIGRAGG